MNDTIWHFMGGDGQTMIIDGSPSMTKKGYRFGNRLGAVWVSLLPGISLAVLGQTVHAGEESPNPAEPRSEFSRRWPDEPPPSRWIPPLDDDRPWLALPREERSELLAFMREHFPAVAEELEYLKEDRPELFERRLRRMAPEFRRLMDIMRSDPQRGQLMIQERKLDLRIRLVVRQVHLVDDNSQKAELREQLRELLGEAFDCRLKRRELEVRSLEARIAELKAELSSLTVRRERIIERQLEDFQEDAPPDLPPADRRKHEPKDQE